ncbi:esterase/lipase family protein [Nannocystis pusilla]|uniref:Lipase n=1 Tax=Nannocystis pusilla TaxID=889268 RepID=A0ABS7TP79_9BACT|nr:hypothetical protein [Nannocystis pusilla]MBZ5709976.1 hypothetical protein [Nannocystis pusilla]
MRIDGTTMSLAIAATAMIASSAQAGGLNDYACPLTPERPYPVVLVHGRGGDVNGFGALVNALNAAGHCVYGTNYGQTNGVGPNGHDHLTVSGGQIHGFIQHVLASTGAEKVDVIGHSAGTGVLNNVILEKDGGGSIHRLVSFGGLHHPYAHVGVPPADSDLFLPNVTLAARLVDPDITMQEIIIGALDLYAGAGGSLAGIDAETAESNFAADLFEPNYWTMLHGGLSEPPDVLLKPFGAGHSLPTADAVHYICYTNIVGAADLVTGVSAGYQDPAPNVDNFLLLSLADHSQILADPVAIAKTLTALGTPCTPAAPPDDTGGSETGEGTTGAPTTGAEGNESGDSSGGSDSDSDGDGDTGTAPTSDGSSGGSGPSDTSSGDGPPSPGAATGGSTGGADGDDAGCGCTSRSDGALSGLLGALALGSLVRRRRR